ncbi:MAG TPA: DUF1015 domain-containing protein [Acidimicrobiales bacterium]|nr:DUF1015 domain-containing protein [Acidimicrobiales bacterium]
MPEFKPFRGIRYDTTRSPIEAVTAPPYDVIAAADRAALLARDPHNVVRIDLPDEADGPGRYDAAARTFDAWLAEGVLARDDADGFYVYRMDYTDDAGRSAHTLGVLGALALSRPGEGGILPHEHTTPKAKTDRLDLLRATRVNLSTIWGLSLSAGLTELCRIDADPDETWSDEDDVTHSLWRVTDPERCRRIGDAVASSAVVVADGHHRYETSVTYSEERRAAHDAPEGAAYALCYVVELTEGELTVRPIHRLLSGVDADELFGALDASFTRSDAGTVDLGVTARMAEAGALCLVDPDGSGTLLVPRPGAFEGVDDLDSARLAHALEGLDGLEVRYQHGVDRIVAALGNDEAAFGVLLRPATVAQIEDNAHSGRRMPPKTTFFHPKPRTGQVFRPTD